MTHIARAHTQTPTHTYIYTHIISELPMPENTSRHQGPVQTSAVYLVGQPAQAIERPPSPPSPPSPGPALCRGVTLLIDELPSMSLDDPRVGLPPITSQTTASTTHLPSPVPSPPIDLDKLRPEGHTVTAPPSPSSRPVDNDHEGWSSPTADSTFDLVASDRLAGAVHVLNAEATALASLATMYSTSACARTAFDSAVSVIARNQARPPAGDGGGTLVMIGVGKSGHIARKLAATFSSLSLRSSFMHPTEALHGDLGLLHPVRDAVVLVSFSGRTPELLGLVPHLHPGLPVVVITAASDAACEIARSLRTMREKPMSEGPWRSSRDAGPSRTGEIVVLPAPIPTSEVATLGIAAPTASTTVALALGDALAVVAAKEIHGGTANTAAVFLRNHPGGAIGSSFASAVSR